ncbi:SufD family Fe-S cluster assembly protein [Collinsella sp. zg1085]|uniref:SufB/SufD family protein n=1 Tax=Collinsella sp. zg1085 TaxID=2844380 RepID=UPI001C0CFAE9|nr:SufD family Fe-S cluster assembly protein [Collinsella sp. zg1085]QWT18117.1 SufD family Fe-S cluster assembly protein [Collinsella sp. zg1085]
MSTQTQAVRSLKQVNAMPAPTWSWLKMNSAGLAIPEGLKAASKNQISLSILEGSERVLSGNADAFDDALVRANKRFSARSRSSAPGDATERKLLAEGALDAMDVPALSRYQQGALEVQEELSVGAAFLTGMGHEAYSYLRGVAKSPHVIDIATDSVASLALNIGGALGSAAVASVDVVVRRGAHLKLKVLMDSPGSAHVAADAPSPVVGLAMRVYVGEDACFELDNTQALSDAYLALDDMGLFMDTRAKVQVRHTVLGAGAAYTGLAADVRGDNAKIEVTTSYLGMRRQLRDFNYQLRHLGQRTESHMQANGVLAGTSSKVLRGTIDLMHGCKGSAGSEQETVLLVDEGVDNKTVPVILCDEDDVQGNHGATIGHVRPEQLFYLACRGFSPEAAEALFVGAKFEEAYLQASDDATRAAVIELAQEIIPSFEEDMA